MAKINPDIEKAFDILRTMSQDKETRALYLSREMALHDEATRLGEAIEEGRAEGKSKGKAEILIKQLNKKFNSLPQDIENSIKKLSEDKLEILALDIFDLKSLDEIYKYI